jgi:hypothetical protein
VFTCGLTEKSLTPRRKERKENQFYEEILGVLGGFA